MRERKGIMVIGIMGDSCTGKSTIADGLKEEMKTKEMKAEVLTGKDYLRLAKNESMAERLFMEKLQKAMEGENLIYVITEKEQLRFLPENAVRVLVTAQLATIQKRFAARMNGMLPPPIAAMLQRKYGAFDQERYDIHIQSEDVDAKAACSQILKAVTKS